MTNWRKAFGEPEIPQRINAKGCKYLLEEELRKRSGEDFAAQLANKTEEYATTIYCKQLIMLMYETREQGQLTRLRAVGEALREIVETKDKKDPSYLLFSSMHTIYNKPDYEDYMDKGPYPLIVDLFYATAYERKVEDGFAEAENKNDFKVFLG